MIAHHFKTRLFAIPSAVLIVGAQSAGTVSKPDELRNPFWPRQPDVTTHKKK